MVRLVGAVPRVQELLDQPVIIGGLAVMSRLSNAYRVTEDLDALRLRDHGDPSGLEILRAAGATDINEVGGVLATPNGDVRVDVLEARPSDLDRIFTDPTDRLEAMAHAWVLRTATPMHLFASAIDIRAERESAGVETTSAVALVARPGPLVATKLKASVDRLTAKEATDLLDVVRMITGPDTAELVLDDFALAEQQLIQDVKLHGERMFAKQRERTLRILGELHRPDVDAELVDAAWAFLQGIRASS